MRTATILFVLSSLAGCEHDTLESSPPMPAAGADAPGVSIAPRVEHEVMSTLPPRLAPLPRPPSDEPAAYKAWFHALSPDVQHRITQVCARRPTSYQFICGGIGPVHVPYPPLARARVKGADDRDPRAHFASYEAWHASLSATQRRYIERFCRGGEDQPSSDLCGDNTPLVVAFASEPIEFTSGATFAFAAGAPVATDWPRATTPWIVLDRDRDGAIESGAELFGDHAPAADGTRARNGFVALAALDANHDGRIDASDPAFAELQLWADRDGDGRSAPGELSPLATKIVAISLANHLDVRCDTRRNCEGERATVTWRDDAGDVHEGAVVDVYLPRR